MNVFFRTCLSLGLAVGLSLLTPSAFSQTDQARSAARETAKAGIMEFRNENYSDALRLLEAAEKVVHAPTHLLYIARSQAKLGLLVEARENYIKIINEELPSGASRAFHAAQDSAREELSELASLIPNLKISLVSSDGSSLQDVAVKIDGHLLTGALIDVPVPVNPGTKLVSATALGMREASAEVLLEEGGTQEITLTLERSAVGAAAEDAAEDGPATGSSDSRKGRRTAGWITMGTGAALIGGGAVLGILSSAQLKEARGDDALCSDDSCTEGGWTEVDQAKMKALIADISMGVGIAAVGVGVYLLVAGKKSADTTTGMRRIVPYADHHGGYLAIQGGF